MDLIPFVLSLVPTVVLMAIVGAFHVRDPRCPAIWIGIILGALAAIPVWIAETVIEGAGAELQSIYQQAFVQQVLGAAVSEELFIFAAFMLTYLMFRNSVVRKPIDVVMIAVAAAIGFTTVENVVAVLAAENQLAVAFDRQLSIIFGHATLQLVMGYLASKALLGKEHRLLYAAAMLVIPIVIHGWGDFAEAIFQYVDPDSELSKRYFTAWILALFTYLAAGSIVIWLLLQERQAERLDASDEESS